MMEPGVAFDVIIFEVMVFECAEELDREDSASLILLHSVLNNIHKNFQSFLDTALITKRKGIYDFHIMNIFLFPMNPNISILNITNQRKVAFFHNAGGLFCCNKKLTK